MHNCLQLVFLALIQVRENNRNSGSIEENLWGVLEVLCGKNFLGCWHETMIRLSFTRKLSLIEGNVETGVDFVRQNTICK